MFVTDKKEVELFDGATGRLMHGVKLRGGQHQAIEAKEKGGDIAGIQNCGIRYLPESVYDV